MLDKQLEAIVAQAHAAGVPDLGDLPPAAARGLYRQILAAGKSVQAVGVTPSEVGPLLNAIGTRGVYLHVEGIADPATLRSLESLVSRLYPR